MKLNQQISVNNYLNQENKLHSMSKKFSEVIQWKREEQKKLERCERYFLREIIEGSVVDAKLNYSLLTFALLNFWFHGRIVFIN